MSKFWKVLVIFINILITKVMISICSSYGLSLILVVLGVVLVDILILVVFRLLGLKRNNSERGR